MIKQITVDKVLEAADIVSVVADDGVELSPKGSKYVGRCPFHQEKTIGGFTVSPARGTYHCFSCGAHGDAVKYVMERKGYSFPDAIRALAIRHNIEIEEERREMTEEERREAHIRSTLKDAMERAAMFFEEQLQSDTPDAAEARAYAFGRWGEDFCREFGIGYAPRSSQLFLDGMQKLGVAVEDLVTLGLVKADSDDGHLYAFFRHRVMIPDRNTARKVVNFTGRALVDKKNVPKYMNCPDTPIYRKRDHLFGEDAAISAGRVADKMYLVEGAPDAMRLRILGVKNSVAPLGTALTDTQLDRIRRSTDTLVIIPDSDPPKEEGGIPPGKAAAIKNGLAAIKSGMTVKIKEIPPQFEDDRQLKADADSYFTSLDVMSGVPEQDFLLWYARERFGEDPDSSRLNGLIREFCDILANSCDGISAGIFIEQFARKKYGTTSTWRRAYRAALEEKQEKEQEKSKDDTPDIEQPPKSAGFWIAGGCYYGRDREGEPVRWSNFILIPCYQIAGSESISRLFRLRNDIGDEDYIQFSPDELVNLAVFRRKLNNTGRYVWLAKIDELMKVQEFIFRESETARLVEYLGHQKEEVYAWGNGVHDYNTFYPVNEIGMATVPGAGTFYLPAFSVMYRDKDTKFVAEKQFIHTESNPVTFRRYAEMLRGVFGDGGMIGLSFTIAAMFRDIIFRELHFFPLLNIFGQKGTGKSNLGIALRSFFVADNKPTDIDQATFPACSKLMASCSNAVIHFDEYKNSIGISKIGMLKRVYDGVGREKINNNEVEVTPIHCAVILSGQELPTFDIALFSRVINLTYNQTEFSAAEDARFNELVACRLKGLSHLTHEVMRLRKDVKEMFASCYKIAYRKLLTAIGEDVTETRMAKCWAVPLAVTMCVSDSLDLPYTVDDLLEASATGVKEQTVIMKTNNEVANFWEFVYVCFQEGKIWENGDYKIVPTKKVRLEGTDEPTEFAEPKELLFLRPSRLMSLYQQQGDRQNAILMSKSNMRLYLGSSKECLGKARLKFDRIIDGRVQYRQIETAGGVTRGAKLLDLERSYVFDYRMVKSRYGINLHGEEQTAYSNDDDPTYSRNVDSLFGPPDPEGTGGDAPF